MRDVTKPLPQLREGDKVLVRRIDTWVEAEVARCANGQVWVRWGSQARWSWRPTRTRSLPWTSVPCDSAFLRRDLSRLPLTPAQRRSLNKRRAKASAEQDLARETRLQQRYYARKFGSAADADGCGGDDDDDDKDKKDNNDDYNNYYSYHSRNSTAYAGENWSDKYRSFSNPNSALGRSAWSSTSRGGGGGSKQYAYALYKGKQYSMAELEAVLADDRKRAPKTDPLREQIRALREELLTLHVQDPGHDDHDYMFEEAYAASDFSSAGGDDDRGWGVEDDIADGWNEGGRQSGHSVSEARKRAPRRERKPRQAAAAAEWTDNWTVAADDEADGGHLSEETTAGRDDPHAAREVDDDDHDLHNRAAASDWANPYDLPSFGLDSAGSVSLSAFDPFPTSASASLSLASFGPACGGSVSYGMPETTTLAAGLHLHDASRLFTTSTATTSTSHTFDDNYCAPTYSDSIELAAADNDYNSRYTTAETYGYSNNDNVGNHNNNNNNSHHYGNESGEDNDGNDGAEEDDEEGDFGGLFSENSARRESRSPGSNELAGGRTANAAKKGNGKSKAAEPAHEAAAAANSGGKAGVIDLRQLKRRQKWEARQVKREEFKRRQRQERKLGAAN